jgi:hypothetical protein
VVALSKGVFHLVQAPRFPIRLEEEGAAPVAVLEQHLIGEPHLNRHPQQLGVEALGSRQVGHVHSEVVKPLHVEHHSDS